VDAWIASPYSYDCSLWVNRDRDGVLAGSDGHDVGYNGQEQYGGTHEEEAGQRMVAIAMAIGAYPDHESHQDGVPYQENIHSQHLPSHERGEAVKCIFTTV
jgi:hypothetical protein